MGSHNITEYLMSLDAGLIPEVERHNENYSCFNTGGIEIEVGEFLYGFIRMTKPKLVLDTGTHRGISTMYIGQALKDNKDGRLISLEIEPIHYGVATKRMKVFGLDKQVELILTDIRDYYTNDVYDFLFLDTEPCYRFQTFCSLFGQVADGGFITIHDISLHIGQKDAPYGPFGEVPDLMKNLILTHQLQTFHLNTPRGLCLFQKRDSRHYTNALLAEGKDW